MQITSLNKAVFIPSCVVALVILTFTVTFPEFSADIFQRLLSWLVAKVSWIYVLVVAIVLIFIICVMISRLGDIKLGPDHAEPTYGNPSWFAMLFSAGMGIGLMFFGVAEPAMHYLNPPVGTPETINAAREALRITFFHWGLHAWGIYAIMALSLAYFAYRHKLPLLPRSALYPIIGRHIYGPIGHITDTFAVVGTLFGVATTLGIGAQQLNAGFNYLFAVPQNKEIQLLSIISITLLATISVVLGLDKGIKNLSNINMILAVLLLTLVLFFGPTQLLLTSVVQNTGNYISQLISTTFNLYAYEPRADWIGGWTIFYWGWWISWSPFVGMFIAQVSRGRTIREFVVGVLFIPAGFTFLWMTFFGNTAIHELATNAMGPLADAVNNATPTALFVFFEYLPFSNLLSLLGACLIITFFVTSADSGALVISTLTTKGKSPAPVWQRVFWASTSALVAAVLLYTGGLSSLQTLTIVSAFPLMFIILLFCYSLFRSLRQDYMLQNSVQHHSTSVQFSQTDTHWKTRLDALLVHPSLEQAKDFIDQTATPALNQLVEQFNKNGSKAQLNIEEDRVRLTIFKEDAENFAYGIRLRHFAVPGYVNEAQDDYYRAEIFLLQGGQQYDVFGYNKQQIIADAITQYERHLHFLYLANSEILKEEGETIINS